MNPTNPEIFQLTPTYDHHAFETFLIDETNYEAIYEELLPNTEYLQKVKSITDWSPIKVRCNKDPGDYPCIHSAISTFSLKARSKLEHLLEPYGNFYSLAPPFDKYYIYRCSNTLNCLDTKESEGCFHGESNEIMFNIYHHEFMFDVIGDSNVFNFYQSQQVLFVTKEFINQCLLHKLKNMCFTKVYPIPKGKSWRDFEVIVLE